MSKRYRIIIRGENVYIYNSSFFKRNSSEFKSTIYGFLYHKKLTRVISTHQHDITPTSPRNGSQMVCSKCGYNHTGKYYQ